MNLFKRIQDAVARLPDGSRVVRLVAGPEWKLPACDQMLPPFISMASLRWDIPKDQRDAMVAEELILYNREIARRRAQDPGTVFGIPFSRDAGVLKFQGAELALKFQGGELFVVNDDDDIRGVDLS